MRDLANDVLALIGCGMIGAGCWLVAPWMALMFCGVLLLAAALWRHANQ